MIGILEKVALLVSLIFLVSGVLSFGKPTRRNIFSYITGVSSWLAACIFTYLYAVNGGWGYLVITGILFTGFFITLYIITFATKKQPIEG